MTDLHPSLRGLPALVLLAAVATATSGASEGPRSVIPWLSESLSQDPWDDSALPMFQDPNGPIAGVAPFSADPIETSSLDDPMRDGVGLLAPEESGFPADLWGSSSALRVRSLISDRVPSGVPAAQTLFRDILIARTKTPVGSSSNNALVLARIDKLLATGHLREASSLLAQLNSGDPDIFRRAFDVALLTGEEESACARLRASPGLSPTLPARVFCLARGGDWDAAALTLQTGHDVGLISGQEELLLSMFLDPANREAGKMPEPHLPITTLDFVLREAVALPRPRGSLPVVFSFLDAAEGNALRTRMQALETLTTLGAVSWKDLFAVYRSGAPASTGGIWDRARVIQDLDDGLAQNQPDAIAPALQAADTTLSAAGLRHAFAEAYVKQLSALQPDDYDKALRQRVFELLVLADAPEAAETWLQDSGDAVAQFLRALVSSEADFPDTASLVPLKAAIATGLTATAPPDEGSARIAMMFDDGQFGEALIRTLDLLSAGSEADPGDVTAGLYLLGQIGLDDVARQVAIQSLFLLPEA